MISLTVNNQNLKIDIFTPLQQIPCYCKSRLGTLRLISWWRVTYVFTFACIGMFMPLCIHVLAHTCTYIHVHKHIHTHTHTHARMHARAHACAHTHTHTHTHVLSLSLSLCLSLSLQHINTPIHLHTDIDKPKSESGFSPQCPEPRASTPPTSLKCARVSVPPTPAGTGSVAQGGACVPSASMDPTVDKRNAPTAALRTKARATVIWSVLFVSLWRLILFWGRNSLVVVCLARCPAWCSLWVQYSSGQTFSVRGGFSLGVNMDSDSIP